MHAELKNEQKKRKRILSFIVWKKIPTVADTSNNGTNLVNGIFVRVLFIIVVNGLQAALKREWFCVRKRLVAVEQSMLVAPPSVVSKVPDPRLPIL